MASQRRKKRLAVGHVSTRKRRKNQQNAVPRLDFADMTFEKFSELYSQHQAVLVRGCVANQRPRVRPMGRTALQRFYSNHPKVVERTFCLESKSSRRKKDEPTPRAVLGKGKPLAGSWYASFIAQKNRAAMSAFLKELPFAIPAFLRSSSGKRDKAVKHSDAMWVFFGQNDGSQPLRGRPEHTDAIAHSGTWHLQLQGAKVWTLRPTSELMKSCKALRGAGHVRVRCEQGDVLCVNTRLWWHRTHLPARCKLSMSVARDMWLDGREDVGCDMTNIDGHYAQRTIERGVVLFTEHDAPELELPRSSESNCGLRKLGDGTMAVVAKRRISAGDWLALSESEEEAEDSEPVKKRKR